MRAGFLPLLKVRLGVAVSLLFLRISFPGLVRLLAGAPVGPLARIGFRCLFAHDFTSTKTKLRRPKGFLIPERITRDGLEPRVRSMEFLIMRKSNWTPSIVPRGDDRDVYLDLGRVWREANYEATAFETVVTDLLDVQYSNPTGIFAFNTAKGWARDESADAAAELRRRCDLQLRNVPSALQDFVDRHDAVDRSQLVLPLRLV
jgi:hypothetical protein